MNFSGLPGDPSRIVHVSSLAHFGAPGAQLKIGPEFDLDSFAAGDAMEQYGVTKLLVNLHCRALSLRLKGTNSESACLHPGNLFLIPHLLSLLGAIFK